MLRHHKHANKEDEHRLPTQAVARHADHVLANGCTQGASVNKNACDCGSGTLSPEARMLAQVHMHMPSLQDATGEDCALGNIWLG